MYYSSTRKSLEAKNKTNDRHGQGMFVTFEGIEGCGKTTQITLLANWLRERRQSVCVTYEPGDTELGKYLRNLLLSPEFSPSKATELLLYLADRAEHVRKVIIPAIQRGEVVLCDRYHDSTVAYQCYGRGINIEFTELSLKYLEFPIPNITFLLDCPVEIGLERLKNRPLDRMEKEALSFHHRVRKGFLKLARKYPERIKVIDATQRKEHIQNQIRSLILKYGL